MFTKVLKTSNLWFDMYGLNMRYFGMKHHGLSSMAAALASFHTRHCTPTLFMCLLTPLPTPSASSRANLSLINKELRQCDGAESEGACCISPVA